MRGPDVMPEIRPRETLAPDRNTVALFDEKDRHIGYFHKPTGQLATPNGIWSEPKVTTPWFTFGNKAHAARLRAADRLGLTTREIPA